MWAFKLKTNQDGFSDASRMRKRAPKDPRQKPSGLQETFKRPKISRRWSQARLTMNLGGAKGPPGRSKTAQDGIKSAPESEEKVQSIRTHNALKTLCFTLCCYVRSSQCWSCWFQVSVLLAHGESCRTKLGDLGPTLQHQWFTSDHRGAA